MKIAPEACRAGRALADWSIRDLAKAAGVSPTTVLTLEQGSTALKAETYEKIRKAFGDVGIELIISRSRLGAVLNLARKVEGRANGDA